MKREITFAFFVTIKFILHIQPISSFLYLSENYVHMNKYQNFQNSKVNSTITSTEETNHNANNNVDKTNNIRSEKKSQNNSKEKIVTSSIKKKEESPKSKNDQFESQYIKVCSTINKERIHEKRYWTHLIFIHADNNLESMSLVDLGEMTSPLQTQTADHLHLVVYIDRCKDFTNKDVSAPIISCPESGLTNPKIKQEQISQNFTGAYILYRWRLTQELRVQFKKKFVWIILEDLGEVDSNSPEILSNFISKSLDSFPSIYSALTLWNHGSAWSGFGDDHDSADGNGMFLGEMYRGIKEGIMNSKVGGKTGENFSFEFKFDILGFDACLMMQFDVLEVMNSLANYILASEDNEPGHGWNFRSLNPVTKKGSAEDEVQMFGSNKLQEYRIATPLEYASRIVYGYTLHSQSYPLTLSLINTEFYRVFRFNLYNLFTILYKCGGENISHLLKKTILNSKKIENCDISNLCSCYDMGDMLELLRSYLSQEFFLDHSIQELLALTLDSYYNMQIASVNIQECTDPESELYGNCQGDILNNRDLNKKYALSNIYDKNSNSLESRFTGVSIYYPDPDQQVLCRNEAVAKSLAKKYTKQTNYKWVQIIGDILINKPGQLCNLELKHKGSHNFKEINSNFNSDSSYPDSIIKTNTTLLNIIPGKENSTNQIFFTSRMDNQVISSQTLITYPISQSVNNMVPISLIFPTRINSNGIITMTYEHVRYEIYQITKSNHDNNKEEKVLHSNLTLITDMEKNHFTGHFLYFNNKDEIGNDENGAVIAYLIFNKSINGSKLLISTSEGMTEKKKEDGGYLVPIIYYLKVDTRRNKYFDEIYQQICDLYSKFSGYLNGLSYPLIGINILPKYDEISIKSRRIQLITLAQKEMIFEWSKKIELRERKYQSSKSLDSIGDKRVLISRYSITSNGYDELSILGVNLDFGTKLKDHHLNKEFSQIDSGKECNTDWLEDGICDIFCLNDNKDCDKVLDVGIKNKKTIDENKLQNRKMVPNFLESHSIYVECDHMDGRMCWRNSKCIKSKGFQHQVIRLIDSKTGKIFFRHSCEDINECEEQNRQFRIEEKEQRQGDIYMGYNTNNAIYPTIERTREITNILNSPFSSIRRHIVTPSGLKRPCHPLALCINKEGGYNCVCKPGYYGDGKKSCIQENVCFDKSFQELLIGAETEVGFPKVIDEQNSEKSHFCPKGLQCIVQSANIENSSESYGDFIGEKRKSINDYQEKSLLSLISNEFEDDRSYHHHCGCKKGYRISSLNQDLRCVDINECDERNNGELINNCGEDSLCTNTIGSYICSCPIGWYGNGYICIPKGVKSDIALKVELSGFFERIVPMGYDNFINSFKQSIIQVLGINENGVEVVDMILDHSLGVIRLITHFKSEMEINNSTNGVRILKDEESTREDLHFNLKKLDEFIAKLKNNTSDWYRKTYIGTSFGDMVNPNKIEVRKVKEREIKEWQGLISKLMNRIMSDKIYIFINSSPFGRIIMTSILVTIIVWSIIGLLGIVLIFKVCIESKNEENGLEMEGYYMNSSNVNIVNTVKQEKKENKELSEEK
ncbi:Clostripain family protein [Cryptosporidium meleagridis]|uniref:Clostripain family protein n=1 Tax=Cryptosporidium meleagridis TaxID=93969 RepID=A0A2P4Z1V2_9CRYT|nr:Clostripain family protein [Cryptosporidium meleagridis]